MKAILRKMRVRSQDLLDLAVWKALSAVSATNCEGWFQCALMLFAQIALGYIRIGGYGRPNYSLSQEDEDMNQNKFNEMFKTAMEAYQKDLRDNNSGAWSK